MGIYTFMVAISIPNAVFLTLIGGFLFGPILGTAYVVLSATFGAMIIFFAAKFAFRGFFYRKAGPWLKKVESGFKENAASYLLFLRLVPLFPFWIINIVPAFFGINAVVFFLSRCLVFYQAL